MVKSKNSCRVARRLKTIEPSSWDIGRLEALLEGFYQKQVGVLGDVGIDRYTQGSVDRISPEAPVPVVRVEKEWLKLGLAANVADNVQVLGGKPLLLGLVGRDRPADELRELLKLNGISDRFLVSEKERRTVLKDRIVAESQQLLRVDYESLDPASEVSKTKISQKISSLIKQSDILILEDYSKGLIDRKLVQRFFKEAKAAGKLVLVDPNRKTSLEVYRGANVLTPNKKEAEGLSGIRIEDEKSLLQAGNFIMKNSQSSFLVLKLGKDGMAIFFEDSSTAYQIPTYAREVYDVSGAGDTVISVLSLALASGGTIEEACILANLAAGVEVGKRGTATVTPTEILMAMEIYSMPEEA
jgi:D-glycero-beta-D-manno-heptose-7-phosphate kinase